MTFSKPDKKRSDNRSIEHLRKLRSPTSHHPKLKRVRGVGLVEVHADGTTYLRTPEGPLRRITIL